jgi:hypothetical protein
VILLGSQTIPTGKESSTLAKSAVIGLMLLVVALVVVMLGRHARLRRGRLRKLKAGSKERILRERRARLWHKE